MDWHAPLSDFQTLATVTGIRLIKLNKVQIQLNKCLSRRQFQSGSFRAWLAKMCQAEQWWVGKVLWHAVYNIVIVKLYRCILPLKLNHTLSLPLQRLYLLLLKQKYLLFRSGSRGCQLRSRPTYSPLLKYGIFWALKPPTSEYDQCLLNSETLTSYNMLNRWNKCM